MDCSVVVIEAMVDEVVYSTGGKHCRRDFSKSGIDLIKPHSKRRGEIPAPQQVSNLSYDLIFRNVPGQLRVPAVHSMAQNKV